MPPPGLAPAPTRRNHVSGGKDTAVSAALPPASGSPPTAERRPHEGSGSSASSLARQHQSTTDPTSKHVTATQARGGAA